MRNETQHLYNLTALGCALLNLTYENKRLKLLYLTSIKIASISTHQTGDYFIETINYPKLVKTVLTKHTENYLTKVIELPSLREIKNHPKVKIPSGKSTTKRNNFNHSEPNKTSLIPLPTFTGI